MSDAKEIPELVSQLYAQSKEYLRQETIEPAKKLWRLGGFGLAAGFIWMFAAGFATLGLYSFLGEVVPAGTWQAVIAGGVTAVAALAVAALIGWRMVKK